MENGSSPVLDPETDLIDPEYAIYDDEGNIIGQFDDNGKESYYEGKGPKPKEEVPVDPAKNDPSKDPDEEGKKNPGQKAQEGREDEPEYVNHADYILRMGGYEGDEISLEDGSSVKIADLTTEQQLNLVTNEFARMREEFETSLAEKPKGEELTEDERHLVEFLRNGGTAKDLAKYIIDNDPDNAHKSLTDDELVLESLRNSMPGASEEDIQEEFKLLKEAGRVEKRAQLLRQKLGSGEIKLADISAKHRQAVEARQAKELEAEIEDAKKLKSYSAQVKEIAGIPVDPTVINAVVKDLIPDVPGEDSVFLKSLASPEKLLRLQFLDKYAEEVFEHIARQSTQQGMEIERERLQNEIDDLKTKLNIKEKHLNKFSDKPIIQFSKTGSKKGVTEPEEPQEF